MNEELNNKIQEVYSAFFDKPKEVCRIMEDQFGAPNVELILPNETDFSETILLYIANNWSVLYPIMQPTGVANTPSGFSDDSNSAAALQVLIDQNFVEYLKKLQNIVSMIIIHFPEVTVTNEYDKSIIIRDLYVRFRLYSTGTVASGFEMIKATYTQAQFIAGYSHSHLPSVRRGNIKVWETPCLGIGPIKTTQRNLRVSYDSDLWGLFAYELSKYVTIESIAGTPYIRLETVGSSDGSVVDYSLSAHTTNNTNYRYECAVLDNFLSYYKTVLDCSITFTNGSYTIFPSIENIVTISNAFIEWNNQQIRLGNMQEFLSWLYKNFLHKCYIFNNKVYAKVSNNTDYSDIDGYPLFVFKGNTVHLRIIPNLGTTLDEANESTLLRPSAFKYIINKLNKALNYYESKTTTNTTVETGQKPFII